MASEQKLSSLLKKFQVVWEFWVNPSLTQEIRKLLGNLGQDWCQRPMGAKDFPSTFITRVLGALCEGQTITIHAQNGLHSPDEEHKWASRCPTYYKDLL